MLKISIASGKGGTGKTTVSVNLAALLSETENVMLCDLDVEEPDSGLFLQPQPIEQIITQRYTPQWDEENCTLCGECQKNCNFNAVIRIMDQIMVFTELCHGCYACSELCPVNALPMVNSPMGKITTGKHDNLIFTEARLNVGVEQAVPLINQTHDYINNFKEKPEIVIMDSPPGTSCPMIHAVKQTDFVILVTEPTPFGLHDLQIAVETVRALKLPFAVVINRGDSNNAIINDYCKKENINVIAVIANSREVAERYSEGAMVYKTVPKFRESIIQISEYLKKNLS